MHSSYNTYFPHMHPLPAINHTTYLVALLCLSSALYGKVTVFEWLARAFEQIQINRSERRSLLVVDYCLS